MFKEGHEVPFNLPEDMSALEEYIYLKMRILMEFSLRCGFTETHPSHNAGDWFIPDGGSLITALFKKCLRTTYEERLNGNTKQVLTDIVNTVGVHRCSRTYCCKPKKITNPRQINEDADNEPDEVEVASACRFHFPCCVLCFQRTEEPVGAERSELPHAPGFVGKNPKTNLLVVRLCRNHERVVSHNPALLLIWACKQDGQYIVSVPHLKQYLFKYISKIETNSPAYESMFSEQLRMMGDGDEVRKLCQSIL